MNSPKQNLNDVLFDETSAFQTGQTLINHFGFIGQSNHCERKYCWDWWLYGARTTIKTCETETLNIGIENKTWFGKEYIGAEMCAL